MSQFNLALLAGDGIGPEVCDQALKVLDVIQKRFGIQFNVESGLVGGAAYDAHKNPLPEQTLELAKKADGVLLGAVGGPQWEALDYSVRPERALLGLRAELGLFANLRPAKLAPALIEASSLKPEIIEGIDIMVVRELTGGIYFGKPRGVGEENGQKVGRNTMVYSESEITRIAKVAFAIAKKRRNQLVSVDKANVLEVTELWRDTVEALKSNYPEVTLSHMYVDNAAMQLIRYPKQFDVIVTNNLFGDILSDAAAMLTGSIGMLPSASLNEDNKGMFEPVHGSAPDIAGQDKANPIATILSLAMMLELSFDQFEAAAFIQKAVDQVLANGYRTADIHSEGTKLTSTSQMGDLICQEILA